VRGEKIDLRLPESTPDEDDLPPCKPTKTNGRQPQSKFRTPCLQRDSKRMLRSAELVPLLKQINSGFYRNLSDVNTIWQVNILLLFQMGLSSSSSTIKMTDVMITAARIAFGIYARVGIINPKANRTKVPRRN
jgi:hypothetical protein